MRLGRQPPLPQVQGLGAGSPELDVAGDQHDGTTAVPSAQCRRQPAHGRVDPGVDVSGDDEDVEVGRVGSSRGSRSTRRSDNTHSRNPTRARSGGNRRGCGRLPIREKRMSRHRRSPSLAARIRPRSSSPDTTRRSKSPSATACTTVRTARRVAGLRLGLARSASTVALRASSERRPRETSSIVPRYARPAPRPNDPWMPSTRAVARARSESSEAGAAAGFPETPNSDALPHRMAIASRSMSSLKGARVCLGAMEVAPPQSPRGMMSTC